MSTVIIGGSHGELRVHRETGYIIERVTGCSCSECSDGYGDIRLFNPVDLRREAAAFGDHMHLDILWCGYWDDEGRYEPAVTTRTIHDPEWGEDYDASVPLAYLPAP